MRTNSSKAKLVVSTALKTLLVIAIIAFLLLFGSVMVAPGAVGDFCASIGMDEIACTLAEQQYSRSKDINDLGTLIDRAIIAENHDAVVKYAAAMMNHRNYAAYCSFVDNTLSSSLPNHDYDHYVRGNLVQSMALTGDVDGALSLCRTYMHFDENRLKYCGLGAYYLLAQNDTVPTGVDALLLRAAEIKSTINALLTTETDDAVIAALSGAKLALYSEINGLLTLWQLDATDWSL